MNRTEKITQRITEEAESYALETVKKAEERAEGIISDANKKAEEIKRMYEERSEKESDAIIARAASSADILERNILLDAKSVIIDEVYKTAEKMFAEMRDERYFDFLIKALKSAIEFLSSSDNATEDSGDEKSFLYVLTLNERDTEMFGEKLTRSVNDEISADGRKMELSKIFGDFSGGLKVRLGNIEVSATTDALLKAAKERTESKVYGILFR